MVVVMIIVVNPELRSVRTRSPIAVSGFVVDNLLM